MEGGRVQLGENKSTKMTDMDLILHKVQTVYLYILYVSVYGHVRTVCS